MPVRVRMAAFQTQLIAAIEQAARDDVRLRGSGSVETLPSNAHRLMGIATGRMGAPVAPRSRRPAPKKTNS